MSEIKNNLDRLFDNIERVCVRINRDSKEISIVGVTKNVSVDKIMEAYSFGLKVFGENRVQEALNKIPFLPDDIEWHFVGHLQTNKVKPAITNFDLIQSVDSLHLAQKISAEAEKLGKVVPVLIEVNSSGEPSKFGFPIDKAKDNIFEIAQLRNINVVGIMTIGPLSSNISSIAKSFIQTYELFSELKKSLGDAFRILSMGMSDDYEIAIECGSNMIRIGRAIFGERNRK